MPSELSDSLRKSCSNRATCTSVAVDARPQPAGQVPQNAPGGPRLCVRNACCACPALRAQKTRLCAHHLCVQALCKRRQQPLVVCGLQANTWVTRETSRRQRIPPQLIQCLTKSGLSSCTIYHVRSVVPPRSRPPDVTLVNAVASMQWLAQLFRPNCNTGPFPPPPAVPER